MQTPADRFLAAHQSLAAHGVRLDGHDLSLAQIEAMARIAEGRDVIFTAEPRLGAVALWLSARPLSAGHAARSIS